MNNYFQKLKMFKKNIKFNFTRKRVNFNFPKAVLAFPFFIIPRIAKLDNDNTKEKISNELDLKEITLGEYENRIRNFASIEKRFLIFANIKSPNDIKMNYFQFLHSMVPFQYIKTRSKTETEELLMKKKEFVNLLDKVDINKDGFINFEEFVIFCLLLNTSVDVFKQKLGDIFTKDDLVNLLLEFAHKELKLKDESAFDGRAVKTNQNTLFKFMLEFFTKEFPDKTIPISQIGLLKGKLFLFISFYEFYRIPQSSPDHISMENFAKVILSYINKNKAIKRKVDNNEISFEVGIFFKLGRSQLR
jgi:hypothetical protein